jgi:hypothetical protein
MQDTERAAERQAACQTLLRQIHAIESGRRNGFPRQQMLDTMLSFLDGHRALFPDEDFASPRAHSRMHPLVEGGDTPYGLYVNVTQPGKEASPHCHGLWSLSAGLSGKELQRFWRLKDPASTRGADIEETSAMTLQAGTAQVMESHDIHSSLTLDGGEARVLLLFARPFAEFPRVVFFHQQWGTRRNLPQGAGRTLRGG